MIVFISFDGLTDQVGTSQILPYVENLVLKGFQMHIVSLEKQYRFKTYGNAIADRVRKSGIKWTALPYSSKIPLASTAWDIYKIRNQIQKIHSKTPIAILHCRSYLSMLAAEPFQAKGIKTVFDMRGLWADERLDTGAWPLKHPIFGPVYKFFKQKESKWLENANGVVSLTHAAAELLQPKTTAPITVIPCCVDMQSFNPNHFTDSDRKAVRSDFGFEETHQVLVYLGALGTWYKGLDMMKSFKALHHQNPNWRMLWISREPDHVIQSFAKELDIDSSLYATYAAAQNEVSRLLFACDWGIFNIAPYPSKVASSPIKQGEYMAMGLPVLANSGVGDSDFIIDKYQSGVLYSDPIAIQNSDLQAFQMPETFRADCADYFGLEKGVEAYASLYTQLLK